MIEQHLEFYSRQRAEVKEITYTAGVRVDSIRELPVISTVTIVEAVRRVVATVPTGHNPAQSHNYFETEMQQWYAAEQEAWQRSEDYLRSRCHAELMDRVLTLEQRCHDTLMATVTELRAADQERTTASRRWQALAQERYAHSHAEMTTVLNRSQEHDALQLRRLDALRTEHDAAVFNDRRAQVHSENLMQELGQIQRQLEICEVETRNLSDRLEDTESREGRLAVECRDRKQLKKQTHDLQTSLRQATANHEEAKLRITRVEQHDRLKLADAEQQLSSVRAEYALEASQLSRTRESQQSHRATTESQIVSLRQDLARTKQELSARPPQSSDRTELIRQREELEDESLFAVHLENEM